MYSVGQMSEAVGKTTDTMKVMEKQLPPEKINKTLREFTAAQERLGVTDEVVLFKKYFSVFYSIASSQGLSFLSSTIFFFRANLAVYYSALIYGFYKSHFFT